MATITAGDIMQTNVVTISEDASLLAAHHVLLEAEVSGAPVVNEEGEVLGIVSAKDILRAVVEGHDNPRSDSAYLRDVLEFTSPEWISQVGDFQDRLSECRTAEFMTDGFFWVKPEASVAEVAAIMRENGIHRVLVISDGQLRGIVSTFDLAGVVERGEW